MFQKTNNTYKSLMFFFVTSIFVVAFSVVYFYENDKTTKILKEKSYVNFLFLIYDLEKLFNGRLDLYKVLYDNNANVLKVLYINSDTVIFRKNKSPASLKSLFNENSKTSTSIAMKRFYADLYSIIGSNATSSDFFFSTSFKTVDFIMGYNEKFKCLLENNFKNKDLDSLNRLRIIEHVLKLAPYDIIKICWNYSSINTNISKLSLIALNLRFRLLKPTIIFCEMPVKYTGNGIEPDKQNIKDFFLKVYFPENINTSHQAITRTILVDVKNASSKTRMAEKIAWVLRENKFDVIGWSNFPVSYDETLIKDYKGNFKQALKIAEILRVGTVLVSYDDKSYPDICVLLGKDCTQSTV
jgi:hypothetical protein